MADYLPTAKGADRRPDSDASNNPVMRGRGRPAVGQRPRLALRASKELHLAIQQWADRQIDAPSQSEAIRRLLIIALTAEQRKEKTRRHKDALATSLAANLDSAPGNAADTPDFLDERSQTSIPDAAE